MATNYDGPFKLINGPFSMQIHAFILKFERTIYNFDGPLRKFRQADESMIRVKFTTFCCALGA